MHVVCAVSGLNLAGSKAENRIEIFYLYLCLLGARLVICAVANEIMYTQWGLTFNLDLKVKGGDCPVIEAEIGCAHCNNLLSIGRIIRGNIICIREALADCLSRHKNWN